MRATAGVQVEIAVVLHSADDISKGERWARCPRTAFIIDNDRTRRAWTTTIHKYSTHDP